MMSHERNMTPAARRWRNTERALRTAVVVGVAAFVSACSDAPSAVAPAGPAPTSEPSLATGGILHTTPVRVSSLKRKVPLAQNITKSVTLYNAGGALSIPEAGLQVSIPRNALPASDRPITITVTALKGSQIAYEFGPSGTRFKAALKVTQDLSNTSWGGNTGNTVLEANYFKSIADLDPASGTALSYETIPTTVLATGNRLHWEVRHFSGYIVCWGRGSSDAE